MAFVIARAVEHAGVYHGDFISRRHENKLLRVRRLRIEFERFVAYRHARAALHRMPIIIDHLLPWAAVNYRLVALDARPLFALVGRDRDGAKLDTFDGL